MATTAEPFTFDPKGPGESPPRRRRTWLRVLVGAVVTVVVLAIAGAVVVLA